MILWLPSISNPVAEVELTASKQECCVKFSVKLITDGFLMNPDALCTYGCQSNIFMQ